MLKRRLIPVLFLKDGWMVRSESFRTHQFIGSPLVHVERMIEWEVDELIILNISNSNIEKFQHDRHDYQNKGVTNLNSFISTVAEKCRIPLTFGGRLRTFEQVNDAFLHGADKVCLNTLIFDKPEIISKCVSSFGSQAIVASVDYRIIDEKPVVFRNFGKVNTDIPLFEWLLRIEGLGVGEVFLNSIDRDGKARGYDIKTISLAADRLTVPVIGCGGAGLQRHFTHCFMETGASGVAAGNIFHFTENAYPRAKDYLAKFNINIRKRSVHAAE